ncbi:MAG: 50S ribosomal protein L21 [Patescibacteria group bacterium]|nr:MAG: 50S ribosomal protein L21 [Patescibacteria group bacterium]
MSKLAVVKTGGKQYLVKEGDIINVEKIQSDNNQIELETLAVFDEKKSEIGSPVLKTKVRAEIIDQLKADKIRIRRFKAKVRYRKVKGHRQPLTKLKIIKI